MHDPALLMGEAGWRSRVGDVLLISGGLCLCAALTISLVLMHVGMAVMCAGLVVGCRPIHRLPGFTWGCLFALWQILGIVVRSGECERTLFRQGYGTTFIWLSMFPLTIVLAEVRWRRWALRALVMATLASFGLALLQFFIGFGGHRPFRIDPVNGARFVRSGGFMPLHLTQGFIMTLVALICSSQRAGTWRDMGTAWAGRLIAIIAVLLANSRAGLLSLLCGFAAWSLAATGKQRWWGVFVLMLAGPLLVLWAWLLNPEMITRAVSLQDGRLIHYEVATHIIGESPWFGVGEGNFTPANDRWISILYPDHSQDAWLRAPDAHNSLLGLASEHGLPAVFFFLLFMGSLLRYLFQRRHDHPLGWRLGCGALAALAVGSQFEHYIGHSAPSYAFFTAMAFALAECRHAPVRIGATHGSDASVAVG